MGQARTVTDLEFELLLVRIQQRPHAARNSLMLKLLHGAGLRVGEVAEGGGIIEVNAAPGLRMHLQPSSGRGRAVGEAVIDSMFAQGDDGRIPVIAVTGTNGKTTTVRLIANILSSHNLRVGMTNTDGVYVEGNRIDTGDCSGPKSAKNVLIHPDVDAAVFETARGGLLREGLGFDLCQVAVVTNIGMGDHLGLAHVHTAEDLSLVKQIVVRSIMPDTGVAVLNAADPLVVSMADCCPGSVTFFAQDLNHPVIAMHRSQGKRNVVIFWIVFPRFCFRFSAKQCPA